MAQKRKTGKKMSTKKGIRPLKGLRAASSRVDVWVITVLAVLFFAMLVVVGGLQQQQQGSIHAAGASPLLFGTNLTLQDANDQFLTSAQTRAAMQQMHVTTVRMPIRSVGAPSAAEIQAAQYIKSINAVPLVILKFSQPDPAGAGVLVAQAMNQIFGTSTVYYEFGNERDLNGVNQATYATTWNQAVPTIKAAAPNGKFGGPVNFQTNPAYIAYFLQNATPAPDFISWHEYTCGNAVAAATCIANIAHWSTHIANTKTAIQAIGKTVPPIFITEWNYDPNNPAGDPRATPQFEQQFVTTALQEFAKDGVTAAYQFVVTGHTEYNLVDTSGQTTPAGQAFAQTATQLGGNMTTTTGTPTVTTPTVATPTFVCAGSQTGICATGAPTPTLPGGTPSASTVPSSIAPSVSLSQTPPAGSPTISTLPPSSISGIVLPSIPQMSGTPPTGAQRDKLHSIIDQIEKTLDALEKKVSDTVHKQIDEIEKSIGAFEKWLLGGK